MYAISNHYWIVANDPANVWSSASAASVSVQDPDYVAWLAGEGNAPTPIASMDELLAVLGDQYPAGSLTTYTSFKRWTAEQAGMTLSSGMPIKTDDRAQAKINGVVIAGMGKSNFTTKWHAADGTFWPLDENAITNMSTELQAHINQCFATSSQVMDGIAGGSITTIAQIDSAFESFATRRSRIG